MSSHYRTHAEEWAAGGYDGAEPRAESTLTGQMYPVLELWNKMISLRAEYEEYLKARRFADAYEQRLEKVDHLAERVAQYMNALEVFDGPDRPAHWPSGAQDMIILAADRFGAYQKGQ